MVREDVSLGTRYPTGLQIPFKFSRSTSAREANGSSQAPGPERRCRPYYALIMLTDPLADVLSQSDIVMIRTRDRDNDVDEVHRAR
jgi:hypothetical protein